ncbi:MAG: type II toxin-antitoxin system VapC family toxin [Planctomycetota bacterium]
MGEPVPLKVALRANRSFLLDSNCFVLERAHDRARVRLSVPPEVEKLKKARLYTSYANLVETIREGSKAAAERLDQEIRGKVTPIPPTPQISITAYRLYLEHREVKPRRKEEIEVPDLYAAAAAIEQKLIVITVDVGDFNLIRGVEYLGDWPR